MARWRLVDLFKMQTDLCANSQADRRGGLGMEWQDIKTEPKDGYAFLSWNGYVVHLQCWSVRANRYILTSGAYRTIQPTHWMPLPDPPAPRDSAKEPHATEAKDI